MPCATALGTLIDDVAGRPYVPLENRQIGLSINVTPPGGHFSFHYDRNEVTAVCYRNEVEAGGEMEFYLRYRLMWPGRRRPLISLAQRATDALTWPPVARRLLGHRQLARPRVGSLFVMEASRCLHRVRPFEGLRDRHSVQFAYDRVGVTFPAQSTKGYYGYR